MRRKSLFTDLGLVYAAAVWGSTFFIVKALLSSVDPLVLVAYRFLFAALLMLPFLAFRKSLFSHLKEGFLLGFLLWLLYVPQTFGLKFTTASNSGFITGLFVAFVPFFAILFFRRRPSRQQVVSVFIALAGLWFLTGGLRAANRGDLLTLLTAAAYAFHILLADSFVKRKLDPYVLSFQQFFFVGVLSLLAALIVDSPLGYGSPKSLGIILFLILFPTLSALVIQLVAQKKTAPFKVALIFTLEPVFAALFAWTLGGEVFIASRAFGGLLIIVAMILSEIPLEKWLKRPHIHF